MRLEYKDAKVEGYCTNLKKAMKLFGGNKELAIKLLSRINSLEKAHTIKDIIVQTQFRFHNLSNKKGRDLSCHYAIDVKTRKEPWRIILVLLKDNFDIYTSESIDKIANIVKIVRIEEVSNHYD